MEPNPNQHGHVPPTPPPSASAGPAACYRHPDRQTRLRCSSCGRAICVDCANQAAVGQKCPDCAKPTGRNKVITGQQIRDQGMLSGAPVTTAILAVSVAIAALAYVAPALWSSLFNSLAHDVRAVAAGEWWRTFTAVLLHSPFLILHVAFNMWALAIFGPQVERRAGAVPYLLLYLGTATAGGVAFQLTRDVGAATGASGAVFGLFGVHLAAAYLARDTVVGRASLRQLGPLLAINLALPLFVPNIAWEAHLGGLLAGALIMFAWARVAPLGLGRGQQSGGPSPVLVRSLVAGALWIGCLVALVFV